MLTGSDIEQGIILVDVFNLCKNHRRRCVFPVPGRPSISMMFPVLSCVIRGLMMRSSPAKTSGKTSILKGKSHQPKLFMRASMENMITVSPYPVGSVVNRGFNVRPSCFLSAIV